MKARFNESLSLLRRVYGTMRELAPGMFTGIIVTALTQASAPLLSYLMSALILGELLGARDTQRLILLALISLVSALALGLLGKWADKRKKDCTHRLWEYERFSVAKAVMAADYERLEDTAYQNARRDYTEAAYLRGPLFNGIAIMLQTALLGLFSMILSVALALPLFVSGFGLPSELPFLNTPFASIAVAAMVLFSALLSAMISYRQGGKAININMEYISTNRAFFYYNPIINQPQYGKDIRLFKEQPMLLKSWWRDLTAGIQTYDLLADMNGKHDCANAVISCVLSGITYLFVALKALSGAIPLAGIVRYVGSIGRFSSGLIDFASGVARLSAHMKQLPLYYGILDMPPLKPQGNRPIDQKRTPEYEIEFHDVSFKYPGAASYALQNVNLKLRVGERLAVVGRNGSGKTTLIKLLCRLYDPTEGRITLNSVDIREYDEKDYLSIFSVVFQDFKLLPFALDENVAASPTVDAQKVHDCLVGAGFDPTAPQWANGLNTYLYRRLHRDGVEISGGEAQKIALARALYKDAPFVVLDEPTAALDPIAEFDIYSRFDSLVGKRTAVYISHRLSSCRFCHDIAVFDSGRLVQRGAHDELLSDPNGRYSALWHAQARYYEEEGRDEGLRRPAF